MRPVLAACLMAGVLAACGLQGERPVPSGKVAAEPAAPAAAEPAPAWTARGNEPGWLLSVADGQLDFAYDYGEGQYKAAAPEAEPVEGGRRYAAEDGVFIATVMDTVCLDDMTGMPHPSTVTIQYTDRQFSGCGGRPADLIAGSWVVEDINGRGIIDGSRVTLAFDPEAGRVTGRSGCNSYGAPFTLGGEGLAFGPAEATEMACADALMNQERAFHTVLAGTTQFAIGSDGGLVLSGPEGGQMTARRAGD